MEKKEKEMIEKAYKHGFECERNCRGCAQCAITGIQDALNIRNDFIYKAGSGLAGGGGESVDGSCGGYSGGTMMMSAFFGRIREEEATTKGRKDKYVSFGMAAELHDIFVKEYGSVICKEIHKKIFGGKFFYLRDDKDKQLFREAGAHKDDDKCCAVVGNGAKWATEIILREIKKRGLKLEDFKYLIYPKQK